METTCDVLVVGGGGSGLAAACSAAQQGARVILLEKQRFLGGTTGIAVGSYTAAATEHQTLAGISDNAADHAEDAGLFAESDIECFNNAELRSYFIGEAATTMQWLGRFGLKFVGPRPEPPNRVPRMHNVVPGAKAYVARLQIALQKLGGRIHCETSVLSLIQDSGRVVGVEASRGGSPQRFTARRGVVLAAGDYANCGDKISRHKGPQFREIEGINPHSTGDGHDLVSSVGGALLNMSVTYGPELRFVPSTRRPFQQWLPATGPLAACLTWIAPHLPDWFTRRMIKRLLVTWQHPEDSLLSDGAILVNRQGVRFVNETVWPDREIAVARQTDKLAYLLLGRRQIEKYSSWPHFISTAPDIAYAYVDDYLRLRSDVTHRFEDLSEVNEVCGGELAALRDSVDLFNHYVAGEVEDPWGRSGDRYALTPPWVVMGPIKAYFTTTEGGAAVNSSLQVLDQSGQPIPGLYAVGQNGLGGMILWGHGLHIAWAMTSGRLAGIEIMKAADNP